VIAFEKFNIQSSPVCKKRDYLFLDQIERYNKIWLCGKNKPNNFKSKKKYMTIKFVSNGKVNAKGFKALLTAKVFREVKIERPEDTWASASFSPVLSTSSGGSYADSSVLLKKFRHFSSTR